MHELDHINGKTMTHWKVSEGNIDVIDKQKVDEHQNLMTTVEFYKNKIEEMKDQFEDELFKDKRQYEDVVDESDGEKWKHFQKKTYK